MSIACEAQGLASNTCAHCRQPFATIRGASSIHGRQHLLRASSGHRSHKRFCAASGTSLKRGARHSSQLTSAALQSVPFNPKKLTVQYQPGTLQCGAALRFPRRYTLTHNDLTGQLLLSVGPQYNTQQLSGWYSRLLRDEILAYWQWSSTSPVLHIECHVSGKETWLAPPSVRDYIFRREMPLVLNIINFAEAKFLGDNPSLAHAKVIVHLSSHVQAYHVSVPWGSLSDCNSWQPPPRWVWSALQPKARAQDLCSSASCVSTDIDSQQTVPSASTDDAQDEPCVIASFSLDSEREPCPPSKVADLCQPSVALQEDLDQATKTQPAPAQAATVEDNTAVSKLKATPHRLHISCAPLVHHISLPPMLTASRRVAFADGLLHSNAAAPVLY